VLDQHWSFENHDLGLVSVDTDEHLFACRLIGEDYLLVGRTLGASSRSRDALRFLLIRGLAPVLRFTGSPVRPVVLLRLLLRRMFDPFDLDLLAPDLDDLVLDGLLFRRLADDLGALLAK